MLQKPTIALPVPGLHRSGRQYQLCYNLKGVSAITKDAVEKKLDTWSIRQTAIHHQFDIEFGTSLWIVTKGRLDIKERYKELTGKDGRPEDKAYGDLEQCFRSSLAPHLLFCHWSTEDWHEYIRWLEDIVNGDVRTENCDQTFPVIVVD